MLGKVYSYAFGAGATKTFPGGRFFKVIRADSDITVELFSQSGESLGIFEGVRAGLKHGIVPRDIGNDSPLVGFGYLKVTSSAAQTITIIVSRQEIDYDNISTSVTPVSGSGLANVAPVAVGVAQVAAIAAAAGRRRIVFMADPANTGIIELGANGLTYGNNPIRLSAGDVWIENDSAESAFYAIASVAAQTLRVQTG